MHLKLVVSWHCNYSIIPIYIYIYIYIYISPFQKKKKKKENAVVEDKKLTGRGKLQ